MLRPSRPASAPPPPRPADTPQGMRNSLVAGLGCNIAKGLASLMGADILCESAPGKGTTMTLHLSDVPWFEDLALLFTANTHPLGVAPFRRRSSATAPLKTASACGGRASFGSGSSAGRKRSGHYGGGGSSYRASNDSAMEGRRSRSVEIPLGGEFLSPAGSSGCHSGTTAGMWAELARTSEESSGRLHSGPSSPSCAGLGGATSSGTDGGWNVIATDDVHEASLMALMGSEEATEQREQQQEEAAASPPPATAAASAAESSAQQEDRPAAAPDAAAPPAATDPSEGESCPTPPPPRAATSIRRSFSAPRSTEDPASSSLSSSAAATEAARRASLPLTASSAYAESTLGADALPATNPPHLRRSSMSAVAPVHAALLPQSPSAGTSRPLRVLVVDDVSMNGARLGSE